LSNELFASIGDTAESVFDKKVEQVKPKQAKIPPRVVIPPVDEEIPVEQPKSESQNNQGNVSFSEDNCQSVNFSENKSSRLKSAVSKENDSSK
jgi:hypothetical protein